MAIKAKTIIVGGQEFTSDSLAPPPPTRTAVERKEPVIEQDPVIEEPAHETKRSSSFILQSSSPFHRDMID